MPPIEVRILGPDEAAILDRVDPTVFDHPILPDRASEFLSDPRHHIAVALSEGVVVGMASGVHYVHPDKAPELWVNEVGVASSHRRRGVAKRLMKALSEHARGLGCGEAWVVTERGNDAANALYRAMGGAHVDEDVVMYAWKLS